MNMLSNAFHWIVRNFFLQIIECSKFRIAYFFVAFLALLAACGPAQAIPASPITETQVQITTVAGVFTQFALSPAALHTATPTPSALPTMPPSLTPTLTMTPPPSEPFNMDNIRMAFVEDGNLYVQDGLNPPRQLTHSGKDRDPILSEDGEIIVFYRGEADDNVYAINADGSQEQLIILSETLPVLGQGEVKALTFVPNSQYLLFNSFLCDPQPQGPTYNAPDCTVGIYSVDTDSGEIRSLIAGQSGNTMQERNFEVSPDGKMLSVANAGHIDLYFIYSSDIELFHQDAILYARTIPDEYLPLVFWLPDSSGLIAVVATDEFNEPTTPPHTYAAWRYLLSEEVAIQIPLTATIMFNSGCNFSISPDREWIYFTGNQSGDITEMPSQYLGNLKNGHTQQYVGGTYCPSSYYSSPKWSPDSRYFAASGYASTGTIGSINGPPIPVSGQFLDWVDSSHYIYQENNESWIGEIGGESVALPDNFRWSSTFVILSSKADQSKDAQ